MADAQEPPSSRQGQVSASPSQPPASGASGQPQSVPQNNGPSSPQQNQQVPNQQSSSSQSEPALSAPVMEINRLDTKEPLYSIELRDVPLLDLFRVIAHDYKMNILVDKDITGTITASLNNIPMDEALEAIADMSNLTIEKKGNIIKVGPNLITKTFQLKYVEAKKLLGVGSSANNSASSSSSTQSSGSASLSRQESGVFDLISDKGKILLGDQPNTLTIVDSPSYVKKIEDYLKVVDQPMARRVFKLKYLRATDVVGQPAASSTSSSTGTTGTTTGSTSSSGTSSSSSGGG
ncbi:MAG: secretin and TonB N-terminal domain-containing protein [Candidatus Omnitrophica bacterium]|nr:secretin and TonB N-terminal domain-containing protein [Candidatus Omnitrophota bacterium]